MRKTCNRGDGLSQWPAPSASVSRNEQRKLRRFCKVRQASAAPAELLESRLLMARDLYVDIASPGPVQDGSSWANAYTDLQLALAAATAGDRILVADGTYKPTATTDRSISFALKEGVSIYGGYAGYGAADPDVRDIALYPAILSGDIGVAGSVVDNSYHVVSASGITSATILDGFTITAGSSSAQSGCGGGMYNIGSSPTLRNCTFSGNFGAMYNSQSSPTLINSLFVGNAGTMYNVLSSPTLVNCTISGNTNGRGAGGDTGAGISNHYSSSPKLSNCILWANSTEPIYNYDSSVPVVAYSDIQGGYAGTGNINADPLFVRTPWTGPDGVSGTGDDDYGDLRLRSGSPALDAGSNAALPAGISTDLAGNTRIQSGTVDLGAYEGSNSAPAPKALYVDLAATGANTGGSWSDAFTDLQAALLAASDGDTIRVAGGTYQPTGTPDRGITFSLRNAVGIYGGYAGYGASDPNARNVTLHSTILSGDIGTVGSNTDNSYHVLVGIGLNSSTILDGFTITGGNASGIGVIDSGGGMYNSASSPNLASCIFTGNSASGSGGGMYNFASSAPTLTNTVFVGNSAGQGGGGMSNVYASATLTNCTFIGNSSGNSGGGMENVYASLTMTSSTFRGNSALQGGGMANLYSSPAVSGCIFAGNSAREDGGGMLNVSSSPTVTNSIFSGNSAFMGGGMANVGPSSSPTITAPRLINCVFIGNSATQYGGGIYSGYSSPELTNSTLAGNSARQGGGIYDMHSSLTLTNGILWGNSGGSITNASSTSVVTYSDIDGGYAGTGNLAADPLFVRNPSSGTDGVWGTADDDYGDLRLQPGSPAIDAGNTAAPGLSSITTDLAGNPRIADLAVDMGAYELDLAPAVSSVLINDGALQRSTVKTVAVVFSEPVTLLADALTLRLSTGQAVPNTTLSITNPTGDQRTFVLSFSGSAAVGGSLADGIYDLSVTATAVQDSTGNPLTANFSQRFHRLFGDADGNRTVNALDYARLKQTFGRASSDRLFNSAFDYEGNGLINALDLARFRQRYGMTFSY